MSKVTLAEVKAAQADERIDIFDFSKLLDQWYECRGIDHYKHEPIPYSLMAHIEALEGQVAELSSTVTEWLCARCNTIYPGPPQPGVWCVQCPRCQGDCGPKTTMLLRKAEQRVARLVDGLEMIDAILCDRSLCGHFTADEIRSVILQALAQEA